MDNAPTFLHGYKSPLFRIVFIVESDLSLLLQNPIIVAALNKVFLAIFNNCHDKFFL